MNEAKTCKVCGQEKDIENFRNTYGTNGIKYRRKTCRQCEEKKRNRKVKVDRRYKKQSKTTDWTNGTEALNNAVGGFIADRSYNHWGTE